jgi:hypothetical protein
MTTAVFWFCVAVIAYTHFGYPLAVWLLSVQRRRPDAAAPVEWPSVSLIVAAHNEESVLTDKLDNSLSLNYPAAKLEIIVASDGSTDGTDRIAASYGRRGVKLVRLEEHRGKTSVQNLAVEAASGDILVFSDANAMYEPEAIRLLVRHFVRDDVGCVEGRRVDYAVGSSAAAGCELAYRDWESRIKEWESRSFSCTGATGPIYAVRRSLYIPLAPEMISDFMEPMLIMARHGKRHIYEPAAMSRETVHDDIDAEFRRKVRIMTRCLNGLKMAPEVVNPFQHGLFALQVISHRLLRWLAPVFACVALAANLTLLDRPVYRATALAALVAVALAALGAVLNRLRLGPAWLRAPYALAAANLAALLALGNSLAGRNVSVWSADRTGIRSRSGHNAPPPECGVGPVS